MKTHINKNCCIGCGLCANICPDVFEIKGDIAEVKSDPVSPENIESCKQATEDCPVSAITTDYPDF